jgi:predicted DsbA family dithiol-disulfide isomerase
LTRIDKQYALKRELLAAYHGRAENVSDPEVLLRACTTVGLDTTRAQAILSSEEYALPVRENEMEWQQAGISAVPAVVVNRQYLISGGQPPEAYEEALRRIAASVAEAAAD